MNTMFLGSAAVAVLAAGTVPQEMGAFSDFSQSPGKLKPELRRLHARQVV